jgi:hypothetical protein
MEMKILVVEGHAKGVVVDLWFRLDVTWRA